MTKRTSGIENRLRQNRRAWIAFALIALFFALHTHQFLRFDVRDSFCHDAYYTPGVVAAFTAGDIAPVFEFSAYPPGYQVLLYLAGGDAPTAYRLKMAFLPLFLLSLLAVFLIGRDLAGPGVGLVAAFLVGAMPGRIETLHKLTPATPTFGFSLLALFLAVHLGTRGRRGGLGAWLGLGVCLAAAVLTHPIALVYAPICAAVLVSFFLVDRARDSKRFALGSLLAGGAFALLAGPWLLDYFHNSFGNYGRAAVDASLPGVLPRLLANLHHFLSADLISLLGVPRLFQVAVFFAPPSLLAFVWLRDRGAADLFKTAAYLGAGWLVFLAWALTARLDNQFPMWSSYYGVFVPVALALAHRALLRPAEKPLPSPSRRLVFGALVFLPVTFAMAFLLYLPVASLAGPASDDWQATDALFFRHRQAQLRIARDQGLFSLTEKDTCARLADAVAADSPGLADLSFVRVAADASATLRAEPFSRLEQSSTVCPRGDLTLSLLFSGVKLAAGAPARTIVFMPLAAEQAKPAAAMALVWRDVLPLFPAQHLVAAVLPREPAARAGKAPPAVFLVLRPR
jgi:hypothetical protein